MNTANTRQWYQEYLSNPEIMRLDLGDGVHTITLRVRPYQPTYLSNEVKWIYDCGDSTHLHLYDTNEEAMAAAIDRARIMLTAALSQLDSLASR